MQASPHPSAGTAVILDGSKGGEAALEPIRCTLLATFAHCEVVNLTESHIVPCLGCFGCWVKTPGVCVKDDDGRRIAAKVMQSDVVVFLTPVTFGGYASQLKRMVDALIQNVSPFFQHLGGEVHHQKRYARYPALLAVGTMPKPEAESEAIFRRLVARNAVNFHAPKHQAVFLYEGTGADGVQTALAAALREVMG